MIWYLFACTIDDMRHLISNNELNVLRRQLITDEQSIFDLDGTNHIWIHLILLLLLLQLLLLHLLLLLLLLRIDHLATYSLLL